MRKLLLILALIPLLSALIFCGCSDYEYDDEYWKSVQREKVMRKSGLNDLADHEASIRQDRLRYQKRSKPQEVSSTSFAVTTIGVVIFIGFVFIVIHLSTKNTDEETDDNSSIPLTDGDTSDGNESNEIDDVIGKLERLANLKDRGAITADEFESEKRKLLK